MSSDLVKREDVILICQAHSFNTDRLMSKPQKSYAAHMIQREVEALPKVSTEILSRIDIHLSEILEQLDVNEKYFSGNHLSILQILQNHIRDSVAEIKKLVP